MRKPGVRSIACAPASSLPADIELIAAAGGVPDISGVQFVGINHIGEARCEVESSNENNGSDTHVKLSFFVEHRVSFPRHVFVVTFRTGESYLIGSNESIPKFTCVDTVAGPEEANRSAVTVELTSFCAWINIGEVIPMDGGSGSVSFDTWREITEEEIDEMIMGLN